MAKKNWTVRFFIDGQGYTFMVQATTMEQALDDFWTMIHEREDRLWDFRTDGGHKLVRVRVDFLSGVEVM